ncbi:nucleoside-triphosphate diphosphatase [Legionella norrlandica]|uniref:dITP/XTP pyrophosphatase n=1 Tax=Legionella norrlandica TaxID=1498499 RepID=A0A0A2T7E4_9GAMM|nr:RdgB/HAM1 family non-canonical purine NTP pyrophosphatase [Legionella norrlandica]KGP63338.1 nucleoside-triphosphate diphosphatase [Legionella norrlandica]
MKEIILATSNPGKIKELEQILTPILCVPQTALGISSAEETGLSFIENAILKARHVSALANKPALADDSGLVVPALNGEPGIYSARYAGIKANDEENIQLLLRKISSLPQEHRHAYFYCAIALIQHAKDPTPLIATGVFHGAISTQPSGTNGFGYDPIFYVNEYQCTAAELPAKIKNRISHRAKALGQLRALLPDRYER